MEDTKKNPGSVEENKVIDLKVNRDESKVIHSKFGNYQPNEELLQATSRIKKQRDVILDRVEKMRAASSKVTRSVFEKVFRDYNLQLQTITELLNEKKEGLKKEIKDLYMRREKITVEINRHREILEEAEFRHYLGEFSQTQYKEVENFETKEIEKLESDLSHISQFIRSHEDLFDPSDLSLPQDPGVRSKEVTKTVKKEEPKVSETALPVMKKFEDEIPLSRKESKSDEIEITDFEDLFLDDEEDTQSKIEQSQASIQKIIQENSIHVGDTADNIVLTNGDSNYFRKDKVTESSFNKTKSKIIPPELEETPGPTHKSELSQKKSIDDSISEILSSIEIDDTKKPQPEVVKKEPVSLEKELEATGEFMLTLVDGDNETKNFTLKENTSIGRSPSNDITLKAPKVSRQHAAINVYNNQYIIIDLKSSNGVFVNGTKVDECILKPGDEVSIGGYKFLFVRTQS